MLPVANFGQRGADERPLFIGITSAFVALQHVSGYHTAMVVGVMLQFALSAQQRTAVTSLSVLACAT